MIFANDEYSFIKHFIAEKDGKPIGTYGIDYLIGSVELLGKGIGKEIVKIICDKVVEAEVNAIQLVADPTIELERKNIASIIVLEANGFHNDEYTKTYKKQL